MGHNETDDTTGGTFTTEQAYTGPVASAEWVVEANTSTSCGGTCQLSPYSPPVRFVTSGFTGHEGVLWTLDMVQGGAQVSTPSALANDNFTVAYTGSQ